MSLISLFSFLSGRMEKIDCLEGLMPLFLFLNQSKAMISCIELKSV